MSQLSVSDVEFLGKRKRRRSQVEAIVDTGKRELARRYEHLVAKVRAKVEHPHRVIKRQFGHVKVRDRRLAGQNRPISGGWMKLRKVFAKQQLQIGSLQNQNRTCSAAVMP